MTGIGQTGAAGALGERAHRASTAIVALVALVIGLTLAVGGFVTTAEAQSGAAGSLRAEAEGEFARWNNGTLNECTSTGKAIIKEYWEDGVGQGNPGCTVAWSASFISYVQREAGAGVNFTYSGLHAHYIGVGLLDRNDPNAYYQAYRPTGVAPKVGDLVCAGRKSGSTDHSRYTFDDMLRVANQSARGATFFYSHCDVVTQVNSNSIDLIGGNVGNSVKRKNFSTSGGKVSGPNGVVGDAAVVLVHRDNRTAGGAKIQGRITDTQVQPFTDFKVDLFRATADGSRGAFLAQTGPTNSNGHYQFTQVPSGCYVTVFILEAGSSAKWERTGSRWDQRAFCVNSDGKWVSPVVQIGSAQTTGNLPSGAVVDVFDVFGDGSRGAFLFDVRPSASGRYTVSMPPGCHILVYIAPSGRVWQQTGSKWLEKAHCLDRGETTTFSPGLR